MRSQYVWLGIRESDIAHTNNLFYSSVTIFGAGTGKNISMERETGRRIYHNGDCPGYEDFFQAACQLIREKNPNVRFIQYDAMDFACFPAELQERFVYQNEYELLRRLNQKILVKQQLSGRVPILPYQLLPVKECSPENLRRSFPGEQAVVLQRDFSCGGSGTFLVPLEGAALFPPRLEAEELCMVSPFESRSIPVNVHGVIYPEDILLFPPSIQLIDQSQSRLEYLGSDYSAFQTLTQEERQRVRETAHAVCRYLRAQGYRGVCGIDLLLVGDTCYFMEVNPRFQASSALLNRNLSRDACPSVQEYHCNAFSHNACTLKRPPRRARGSFITFSAHSDTKDRLAWLWNRIQNTEHFSFVDDGLDWNRAMDDGAYLFQLHRDGPISSTTFQHTPRLHPNVTLSPFGVTGAEEYNNVFRLKLLLLARGVSITPAAWAAVQRLGSMDWEEFSAISLLLFHEVWITAPCMEQWSELSPLQVDAQPDGGLYLSYYGSKLMPIEVLPEDPCGRRQTASGHYFRDVVYRSPDRLRVYHRDGCVFQDMGTGCQFCDLYGVGRPITFTDIEEALSAYWENPQIEHFLIGGGSNLPDEEYRQILMLADYLHAHSDRHIYLMSQPISDPERLRQLHEHGVTEVAFNLEVVDPEIAHRLMPGKSRYLLSDYLESLRNAAAVFGSNGTVRSAVLVGFDDLDTFKTGIRQICEAGAAPILSLFRACPGTPLENYMPFDETAALAYYNAAKDICGQYGLRLGPSCKACQNNTIALDWVPANSI